MTPKIRNAFSTREPTLPEDPGISLTQQHFKEETEINSMVRKYMKGHPLSITNKQAKYGDFANAEDFHTMKNAIADIDSNFASLPAKLRGRFKNDPYQLLRWLENPANHREAVKLGLMEAPLVGYDPDAILKAHETAELNAEAEKLEREAKKADPEAQPGFRKPEKSG